MKFFYSHTTLGKAAEFMLATVIAGYAIVAAMYPQYRFAGTMLFIVGLNIAYRCLVERCRKKIMANAITAAHVTAYFMYWTAGKLFASIVFLFVNIKFGSHLYPFLLSFMILYLAFMLYEIVLMRELNKTINN